MFPIICAFIMSALTLSSEVICEELQDRLDTLNDSDFVMVMIFPQNIAEFSNLSRLFTKKSDMIRYLREKAHTTQKGILEYLMRLTSKDIKFFEGYWINGAILAHLSKRSIIDISKRDDVLYVEGYTPPELLGACTLSKNSGSTHRTMSPWGIQRVNAEAVWKWGYTGRGVLVGHMDTGVEVDHPALEGKWSGYWLDIDGGAYPYDNNGHGTHTMGTILGGDGLGDFPEDIGVAPGATFAVYRMFGDNYANPWPGFQWFASLVADSGVPIRIISNSWGTCDIQNLSYWFSIEVWRALNIVPVFAVGNSSNCGYSIPPPYGTAMPPGNYSILIGVGATDTLDYAADFSLKGPAPDLEPWNVESLWCTPDWNLTKPDIGAPGTRIKSSIPGGDYGFMDGTSMSCPHVAGAIALLFEIDSTLNYCDIYNLLAENSYKPPPGAPYPNNDLGWGRLDVFQTALPLLREKHSCIEIIEVNFQDLTDHDGVLDSGEQADIYITIFDSSNWQSASLSVAVSCDAPEITLLDSVWEINSIAAGDTISNTSNPFIIIADTVFCPRFVNLVFRINATPTSYPKDDTFRITLGQPYVYIVDDDGGDSLESYYKTAFDSIGTAYTYWNVALDGLPPLSGPAGILAHSLLVWFTGSDTSALNQTERNLITDAINSNINLFISSQYLGETINGSNFMQNVLHANVIDTQVLDPFVEGSPGNSIFAGIRVATTGGGANNAISRDAVEPLSGSQIGMVYPSSGLGACIYTEDCPKIVYLPFPFEAVNNQCLGYTHRADFLKRILKWFEIPYYGITENNNRENLFRGITAIPNITRSSFDLSFTASRSGFVSINLLSVSGRLIKTINFRKVTEGLNRIKISLDGLPSGIYFIEIRNKNSKGLTKVIKI